MVLNVALYEAESWIILKANRIKIKAFKTWCWRRALKISWTERISNEDMYKKKYMKRGRYGNNQGEKKKWIRHLRNNAWVKSIIEGKIVENPGRRRPR